MKKHKHVTANEPESKPGSLPVLEAGKQLGASPDGLSQAEMQKRLAQHGPVVSEEKQTNPFLESLNDALGPIRG